MGRWLCIDDIRGMNADRVERTYSTGIKALQEEKWDGLYLDHDLSDFYFDDDYNTHEWTGYDVLLWLKEHKEHLPGKIVVVSMNPAGKERMLRLIEELYADR